MKKLLVIALLVFGMNTYAQFRVNDTQSFNVAVQIDPNGSIKEKGICLKADIETISNMISVKAGVQYFSALKGGYLDFSGGVGLNFTSGYFSEVRYYAGVRAGLIKRGFEVGETYTYPLLGVEGGLDYMFSEKVGVRLTTTYDKRADGLYTGGENHSVLNGYAGVIFKF